jgi:hypothetical protein
MLGSLIGLDVGMAAAIRVRFGGVRPEGTT